MNTSPSGIPPALTAPTPAPARRFHRLAVAGALLLGALAIAALAFYATRGPASSPASVAREIQEPKSAAPDFLNQAPRRQHDAKGDGPDPRLAELLRPRLQQEAQSYRPPASPSSDPTTTPGSSTLDAADPGTTGQADAEPAFGAYRPFPGVRYTRTASTPTAPAARPSWEAAFRSSLVPTSATTVMNEPRLQQSLFGVPPPPDRPTDPESAVTSNANDVRVPQKATSAVDPARTERRSLSSDAPILPAGTVINAILLTAVNTEQPGNVTAQVSTEVRAPRGGSVLIPAGARLIGSYNHQVSVGDSRVAIAWTRLALGSRILDLPALPGAAIDGSAGQPGSVNHHSLLVFGRAALLSLISAGAQLSQPRRSRNDLEYSNGQVVTGTTGQELSSASTEFLKRAVNVAPTITVPAGTHITVLLPADLPLPLSRD